MLQFATKVQRSVKQHPLKEMHIEQVRTRFRFKVQQSTL
jgi:hypothetical protein